MEKEFGILVFIGRFQPFHNGHKDVIDHALRISKKVIVLAGSANRPRNTRNPFTFEERAEMITSHYNYDSAIVVRPLDDIKYNDVKWTQHVQDTVAEEVLAQIPGNSENVWLSGLQDVNVGLIGCKKDGTSYYLNLFPKWKSVDVDYLHDLDGTAIRKTYFDQSKDIKTFARDLPQATAKFLNGFYETDEYAALKAEVDFIKHYNSRPASIAEENDLTKQITHPTKDTTADAVIVQSGHVLLIERKIEPGRGLLALPGGHMHVDETFEDCMIRELNEETRLKVPEKVLRGSIKKDKVFDDPHRSERGRVITRAFYILLQDGPLPRCYAADDAKKAFWLPLSELKPINMLEDHYDIIMNMIGN